MIWSEIFNVFLLQDYNTRLVVISTMLLGIASGLIGGFLLLRKHSLMGDTLSHATLPGVGLAFAIGVLLGESGKSLPVLLFGAAVSAVLGFATVLWIRSHTRIKDDAAMGIVLSVFFGLGVVIFSMVQQMPEAGPAGLESFIYGKTASMVMRDFQVLLGVTLLVLFLSVLLFKEFRLLCFDESYAAAQGWPVRWLDIILFGLVTCVTVAGLQAVGLILIIAFLITPAAAARFWTHRLDRMLLISAGIGGLSGWMGASVSALLPGLPAGALIVLVAFTFFAVSLFIGVEGGVLIRLLHQLTLRRTIGRQHLLRAAYEILEAEAKDGMDPLTMVNQKIEFRQIRGRRSWSDRALRRYIHQAYRAALVELSDREHLQLTLAGFEQAAKVTRNHRLWEIYLIEHADTATSHVDRDADALEHILGDELVRELEQKLETYRLGRGYLVPASPHPIIPGD